MGLECNSAVLAARRVTEDDIALLEESLAAIRNLTDAGETAYQEDVSFHMRIAYASKNPVQINLMKHFYDLLLLGIRDNLSYLYRNENNKHLLRAARRHLRRHQEPGYSGGVRRHASAHRFF